MRGRRLGKIESVEREARGRRIRKSVSVGEEACVSGGGSVCQWGRKSVSVGEVECGDEGDDAVEQG